ncbi:MAG TPA: hypothetical protein VE760_01270, partial [Acidimicrobiales bacterium]|nr:hypothetical protein [Acidimicrobiales bacterium]
MLADYVAFMSTTPVPRAEEVLALDCGTPVKHPPGTPLTDAVEAADALASRLAEQGWAFEALSTRVLAGRLALVAGDRVRAARTLAATAGGRTRGTVARRVEAWRSEVLRRLATGDRSGARRAISAGLRVIEEYRTTLRASDLRAHVSALG